MIQNLQTFKYVHKQIRYLNKQRMIKRINPYYAKIKVPMALGSTQPLTEMSTRNISWG
jgi:hypothetical protein